MDAATLYQHLFGAAHRLYALEGDGAIRDLAIEAWTGREAAIGVVAGLSSSGENNIGLQLTAGQDDIDLQAQHDLLKLAAREDLTIVSANMNVDFAAAKRIRIATAGGAAITIEGGNITIECPGPITYKAAQRTFEGPVNINRAIFSRRRLSVLHLIGK